MHPSRTEQPRAQRRTYHDIAQQRRSADIERQALGYRLNRQAQTAADMARMVAKYNTFMGD